MDPTRATWNVATYRDVEARPAAANEVAIAIHGADGGAQWRLVLSSRVLPQNGRTSRSCASIRKPDECQSEGTQCDQTTDSVMRLAERSGTAQTIGGKFGLKGSGPNLSVIGIERAISPLLRDTLYQGTA